MVQKMPYWSVPSPQENGRKFEKKQAKKKGAREHPASGAVGTKGDYSTEDTIYEQKVANKTHTINGEKLDKLLKDALGQGKDAVYTIYFEGSNLTLEGVIRRGE